MNKAKKLLSDAAQRLELPADIAAGLPKMELTGTVEFSLEPHRGLLEYEKTRIAVSSALGTVEVLGQGLSIKRMNQERITIVGQITAVELPEDGIE